ncbi:MAG TPA: FliA/WhiG family RNA polymerase sigma factor [Desulfotomaculum sp.]|nr:MAG: RNA polymerase sigma factor [Desulfotomaculum sp. 46_80]HAG11565.1 FliA/WhiG family RNA polymerase sigma factor [Desulfotomaculum sp.]HBY03731.1 FliA/WhiG family RNA polymerase sigma factor [Desulfotomaculum sp.]
MEAEEKELWEQYQRNPDYQTKEKLVTIYLPLVKYLAGRMAIHLPAGIGKEDLESCGVMGLLEAIKKFVPERGTNFTSFAQQRIKGAMIDEIRRLSWVPRRLWQQINMVEQAKKEITLAGKEVNESNLVEKTGLSQENLKKINGYSKQMQVTSLDQDNFLEGKNLLDFTNSEPLDVVLQNEKHQILAQAISSLESRDKLILALYYQERLTLKEISLVLSVTESRVCQLHSRAISRLRDKLEDMSYV